MKQRRSFLLWIFVVAFIVCIFVAFAVGCTQKREKPQAVQLAAPQNVRILGGKVCWDEVENTSSYRIEAGQYIFTTTQTEYSLGELQEIQQYMIYVYAVGDGVNYSESKASKPVYYMLERGTNGLQYNRLEDGTYEVSKGTTTASEITVPAFYNGKEVTQVADEAFYDYKTLRIMNLPSTIKKIGDSAFSASFGSVKLAQINFPEGLEYIGNYAFESGLQTSGTGSVSSALRNVKLPESLKYIGKCAFDGCAFTEITIPEGIEYLGESAFSGCRFLEKVVLPQSLTEIQDNLFYNCKSLYSINLSNIESVGSGAFALCSRLVYINLPERLKYVGSDAFNKTPWYTLWLEQQPEGLLVYKNVLLGYKGEMPQDYVIDSLPQGVNVIAGDAFSGCKNLKAFNAGGWTAIGDGALNGTSITQITIPSTAEIFGLTFCGNSSLETVVYQEGVKTTGEAAFINCIDLKNVTLPESLVEISSSTFRECTALENITIPDSVSAIGNFAFFGCTGIKELNLPQSVNEIGEWAFSMCKALEKINIPDKVTAINYQSFSYCVSLKKIIIPENVTVIGENAFSGCVGLTKIIIPDKVTEIGKGAFLKCTGLTEITITYGVTKISESAFQGCTSLEFRYITESVTVIERGVFAGCTKITQLTIPASVLEIDYKAFCDVGMHDDAPTIYPTVYIESGSALLAENIRHSYVFSGCELSEDKSYVVSFTKTEDNIYVPYSGPLNDPTRKGYDFGGWTTVADGTVAEYTTENLTEAPDGTVLYAIWIKK